MKLICILIATCIILPFNTDAKNKSFGDVEVIKVTSIYDGGSFRAGLKGLPAIVGEHMAIRINGIDTPELRGKCEVEKQLARKAKQFTVERLRATKSIVLKNIKRGKYFRLIADVYIDGVSQDYKEAIKWYLKAAELGDADAQLNLGLMYNNGQGVIQSNKYAYIWSSIAAANGSEKGSNNRDILAKRLSASTLDEAQREAAELYNKISNRIK